MNLREYLGQMSDKSVTIALGLFTIVSMLLLGGIFLAPLRSLPADNRAMRQDIGDLKTSSQVQAANIAHLAEAAAKIAEIIEDQNEAQRTLGQHEILIQNHDREIQEIKETLKRLN